MVSFENRLLPTQMELENRERLVTENRERLVTEEKLLFYYFKTPRYWSHKRKHV
jgi:hypothetical protein